MPGEKGVAGGRSLGLHEVPGGSARGGPEHVLEILDVETSMGAANFEFPPICTMHVTVFPLLSRVSSGRVGRYFVSPVQQSCSPACTGPAQTRQVAQRVFLKNEENPLSLEF